LLRENQARQIGAIEKHLCFHSLRTEKESNHKESLCNQDWLQYLARVHKDIYISGFFKGK